MIHKTKTKKGEKTTVKRGSTVSKTELKLKVLRDVAGSASGVWREDAQEYVNKLRQD